VDDIGRIGERTMKVWMVERMIMVNIPPAKGMYVYVQRIFFFSDAYNLF
jgi:hypothetical protein